MMVKGSNLQVAQSKKREVGVDLIKNRREKSMF
jgi:hypothetical protein